MTLQSYQHHQLLHFTREYMGRPEFLNYE